MFQVPMRVIPKPHPHNHPRALATTEDMVEGFGSHIAVTPQFLH